MAITRYEPWSLLSQLQKELEHSLDTRGSQMPEGSAATAEWAPSVDIKEEADRYVLIADLPGVAPEHIDIMMENDTLTIKGERTTEAKEQRDNYKRIERVYGSFYRRFSLPDTADAENISARYNNGVLEVTILKKASVQPKKIIVGV